MPCVPDCALCHGVSPGTKETWVRKTLGIRLERRAVAADAESMKAAVLDYKADPANAASVAALARGVDPQTGQDICLPSYGCGATIAPKAARHAPDRTAAIAGILALLGGLFLVRRQRR